MDFYTATVDYEILNLSDDNFHFILFFNLAILLRSLFEEIVYLWTI